MKLPWYLFITILPFISTIQIHLFKVRINKVLINLILIPYTIFILIYFPILILVFIKTIQLVICAKHYKLHFKTISLITYSLTRTRPLIRCLQHMIIPLRKISYLISFVTHVINTFTNPQFYLLTRLHFQNFKFPFTKSL